MLTFIHQEMTSGLPLILATADGMRSILPILLLSVPGVMLFGIAVENPNAGSVKRKRKSAERHA